MSVPVPENIFDLPIALQVALGSGYMAYRVAYIGLDRNHAARDSIFISLIFGAVSLLAFNFLAHVITIFGHDADATIYKIILAIAATVIVIAVAGLWRRWLKHVWFQIMVFCGFHKEDGIASSWDKILQAYPEVGQIAVHKKNGDILYQIDRNRFRKGAPDEAPEEGLYLGSDGSIVLAVEAIKPNGGKWQDIVDVADAEWGATMTYVPADEIAQVNIRVKVR